MAGWLAGIGRLYADVLRPRSALPWPSIDVSLLPFGEGQVGDDAGQGPLSMSLLRLGWRTQAPASQKLRRLGPRPSLPLARGCSM